MKVLSKADVLGLGDDRPVAYVPTPEWGEDTGVYVRAMTAKARDQFEVAVAKNGGNVRARFACSTVCDADGNLLFTEADVELLGEKSGVVLDRIWTEASRLGKLSKADQEELEKN